MSSTLGGALGFLTTGTTPATSQQESESSTSLPSWYTNYTQQILNDAAQYAAQPYQTYSGPRIASQSNLTEDAYGSAPTIASNASAGTTAANNAAQMGLAQNNNVLGDATPYYGAGASDVSNSLNSSGLSTASPYLSTAYNNTGAGAVQSYMNPYNQDVTNAIATAANTNFQNNTLPALQSSIIGAGNITGSSTEGANLIENAEQQNEQNINNQQAAALQSGYNSSLTAAQQAASTQAGIGSTLGTLGTQAQTAQQNAGTDLANIGTSEGNLASTQAQNSITGAGALSNINTAGTTNAINAANNENTLGEQNQGYTQANENLAYQDFENQLNYPLTQASALQGALSGINVPTTTTNYGAGTGTPATIGNSALVNAGNALSGLSASTASNGTSGYNTAIPTS